MEISKILTKCSVENGKFVYVHNFDTPVGKVTGVADDNYLYMISFEDSKNFEKKIHSVAEELSCKFVEKKNKILQLLEEELSLYFDGKLKKFTVPIKMIGSEFQREVWNKLLEMPYGSTQSYGDVAESLGRAPNHARAIGAACGANAHLVVIPCHRIVASGSKGGFSSGVDRKEWLLQHEQKNSS